MTMRDLAKLTNVSVSTVSKTFHHAEDISEATREMIFETAKKYGCFGKFYKEKYFKKIIAIICPELRSYMYADTVYHLQRLIEGDDGIVLISTDEFDPKKQEELIEYYASYLHVDGILVFGCRSCLKRGIEVPIVAMSKSEAVCVDSVNIDIQVPIFQAVAHLCEIGHRKIAFLGEPLTLSKEQYFRQAMQHQNLSLSEDYVIRSAKRFEQAGEDGAEQLLKLDCPPTAMVCAYDYIAYGAIGYLTRKGIRVPEDISVIGMDNIHSTEYIEPQLTSIDTGYEEACRIAWELLCKKIENPYHRGYQKTTVIGELVLRRTTGPVNDLLPTNKKKGGDQIDSL